ncbi:hypothetical protein [Massilia sp. PWRC2]|uniref:hypothetical protein n=1 Tax=Massilia sp. PWRC2 TaxID=2804626 RepID=UPI003CEF9ACB
MISTFSKRPAHMSYQYSRLHSDIHRDVAHWRGAKGGVRVLSLPSCAAWLQRHANDASYDFWSDMAIVAPLPARTGTAAPAEATQASEVFILHKEADGSWLSHPWHAEPAANGTPPEAAQLAEPSDGATESIRFIIEISGRRG